MRRVFFVIFVVIAIFVAAIPCSPAFGLSLFSKDAHASEVTGNFTVMLYGGRYSTDVETVAFLIPEPSKYTFELYAPDFDYKVVRGVPAADALHMADQFVRIDYAFLRSELNKILDVDGSTIGFEVRPLYQPLEFGTEDVLDISYGLSNSRVRIYVRLKPEVWNHLFGGGGGTKGGGR